MQAKHNRGVQCDICGESLPTEHDLKLHLATKHNNGLLCLFRDCPLVFGTQPALKSHLAQEHNYDPPSVAFVAHQPPTRKSEPAGASSSRYLPTPLSDRVASSDIRRRSAATTPRGGYQLPSQYQELKVPVSSTAQSEIDQFLRSQQSWNHEGLLSYTSLPSQAPPPTGPPSVTHSMQHSPLHHQPKSKRSRPSNSQPTSESVAGTVDTASVAGSDRTCHTCTIEFPFPRDLKSAPSPKHTLLVSADTRIEFTHRLNITAAECSAKSATNRCRPSTVASGMSP